MATMTRVLKMAQASPTGGLATPTRLYTSPASGYAVTSKLRICNRGAVTTFNVWIGNNIDTEQPTQAAYFNAFLGAAGAAQSVIESPGGDVMVNGGWVSVSSASGAVSFHLCVEETTIT